MSNGTAVKNLTAHNTVTPGGLIKRPLPINLPKTIDLELLGSHGIVTTANSTEVRVLKFRLTVHKSAVNASRVFVVDLLKVDGE